MEKLFHLLQGKHNLRPRSYFQKNHCPGRPPGHTSLVHKVYPMLITVVLLLFKVENKEELDKEVISLNGVP